MLHSQLSGELSAQETSGPHPWRSSLDLRRLCGVWTSVYWCRGWEEPAWERAVGLGKANGAGASDKEMSGFGSDPPFRAGADSAAHKRQPYRPQQTSLWAGPSVPGHSVCLYRGADNARLWEAL